MKQIIVLWLFFSASFSVFGQGKVDFSIEHFKEENDTLYVTYHIRIGASAVDASQSLQLRPLVESSSWVIRLPGVNVLGRNKQKVLARAGETRPSDLFLARLRRDTVLTQQVKIPYELWMDSATLVVAQQIAGYRRSSTLSIFRLKDKVELTPREPYRVNPVLALIAPAKETKVRRKQGKAYLDFQVGRSVIIPTYRRNPEELLQINEAIREVAENPDALLQGLYIEGYASPDGAYATNERLARERSEALKEYIRLRFGFSESLFKVSSVAEDWDGLAALVQGSDMKQKEQILQIISSVPILKGREGALMRLDRGVPYRFMLKEMFPELRRVEYQIDYGVKDFDLKQTQALLDKKPGDLSELELYTLARSYEPASPAYNHILLEVIPTYFATSETAQNNAATVLLNNRELATARRYLSKAGESAAVLNNRGVLSLLEGDLDQAEALLTQAQALGSTEAISNLNELRNKREDTINQKRYK